MSNAAETKEVITICEGTRLLDRIIQVSEASPYKGQGGLATVEVEASVQKKRNPRKGRGGRNRKMTEAGWGAPPANPHLLREPRCRP